MTMPCYLDIRLLFRRMSGPYSSITEEELNTIANEIQLFMAKRICALLGGFIEGRVEMNFAGTIAAGAETNKETNTMSVTITRYTVHAAYVLVGAGAPPVSAHDHDDILFLLHTVLAPEFNQAFGSDITLEEILVDHHHCPEHSTWL